MERFNFYEQINDHKGFSEIGCTIKLPQDTLHWMQLANERATINATVGVMRERGEVNGCMKNDITCYLPTLDRVLRTLTPDQIYPYAPVRGLPAVRQAWRSWLLEKANGFMPNHSCFLSTPIVTNGVTNALFVFARLFLNKGDVVVTTKKRWGNYDLVLKSHVQAQIADFEPFSGQGWNLEGMIAALRKVPGDQRRFLLLNLPFNPCGYMITNDEASAMKTALIAEADSRKTPLYVVCDDAYEGFVFTDDALRFSLFHLLIDAHPNLIPLKADGISKEFFWWGGRLGFLTFAFHPEVVRRAGFDEGAPPDKVLSHLAPTFKIIEDQAAAIVRSSISNVNLMSQHAIATVLKDETLKNQVLQERAVHLEQLRKRVSHLHACLALHPSDLIQADPCNAGFFIFLNIAPQINTDELAMLLLTDYGIGAVPSSKPERNINGIRITFASVPLDCIEYVVKSLVEATTSLARKQRS